MANIEIFKKFGISSVAYSVTYSASLNVFTGNGYTSAVIKVSSSHPTTSSTKTRINFST